jgi:hypothetical protein
MVLKINKNEIEKLKKTVLKTLWGPRCLLSDVQISSHQEVLCVCVCARACV